MKKIVLVVAMFMFVCSGSFLVKAQNSAKAVIAPADVMLAVAVNDTISPDTIVKDTTAKDTTAVPEPTKEEPNTEPTEQFAEQQ
ncbi:hypothetical protein IX307_002603 [Bacteroides pyogenes]|jgi:hypothetical protein|uniref:Uncharacterized protein n=1 Tax=Bacteroides pyogenes TaxID=310300 RepID=A0A5D3FCN1_9BACE|nr:hypothetical protein [Bacteroides pyogenes]MBR8705711.1 hypothetical protein [Bacteroides pyogenes]MBR8708737.1 hypothetical protein [Bacteroides pyogenes]MBR8717389.1 hypothetical protein [Bacteroides pyogenes]MBR8721375.1 hypothetical protein [Bacteroides pyogenes]MBR8726256.1 hypothetical protein [Bacteroides pyogenes]